jgi:hypothetical protein
MFHLVRQRNQLLAKILLGIVAVLKFQRLFGERLFNFLGVNHTHLKDEPKHDETQVKPDVARLDGRDTNGA